VEELYTARMLGTGYLQRNQLPEAEAEFKKLTRLAPDDPLGYADLGLTYLQAGRYAEAEKQLRRARELDPGSSEVGLALARLYSLTGRASEARATPPAMLTCCTRSPSSKPGNPIALRPGGTRTG
jgi:Flp pilus assembly protein TadD